MAPLISDTPIQEDTSPSTVPPVDPEPITVSKKDLGLDPDDEQQIALPNIKPDTIPHVIQWLTHHKEDTPNPAAEETHLATPKDSTLEEWDLEFFQSRELETVFEIMLIAYYVDIKALINVSCKFIGSLIRGKTPEEIRNTFNIKNDFTPEEEEAVRRENEWSDQV